MVFANSSLKIFWDSHYFCFVSTNSDPGFCVISLLNLNISSIAVFIEFEMFVINDKNTSVPNECRNAAPCSLFLSVINITVNTVMFITFAIHKEVPVIDQSGIYG